MSAVDPGKWSCPSCGRTVTVYASEPDQREAIAAIQYRHADAHRAAATLTRRLGPLPRPRKRAA